MLVTAKDKDTFRRVLMLWSSYYRDAMLTSAQSNAPLASVDRAEEITTLAKSLSLPQARKDGGRTSNGLWNCLIRTSTRACWRR